MENNSPAQPRQNMMQVISSTPAIQLAALPEVASRFITLLQKTQGLDLATAEMTFETEKYHFQKALSENAGLRECEPLSLYGCFCDCAVQGLSFDPKKKLAYLIPGSVNIGTKDAKQYVKRANLEISPYGELAIRQKTGQIKYADNPVIVYDGDQFEPYEDSSGKGVIYRLNPSHGTAIIGAFIHIVRIDGTHDYHWLLKADWERLAGYSEKKNFGKANALYSSYNGGIDPGFLAAKMIKHAFRSYPKVNLPGQFSKLAELAEEAPATLSPAEMYGFNPGQQNAAPAIESHQGPNPEVQLSDSAKAAMLNATAPEPSYNGTVQHHDETGSF